MRHLIFNITVVAALAYMIVAPPSETQVTTEQVPQHVSEAPAEQQAMLDAKAPLLSGQKVRHADASAALDTEAAPSDQDVELQAPHALRTDEQTKSMNASEPGAREKPLRETPMPSAVPNDPAPPKTMSNAERRRQLDQLISSMEGMLVGN